MIAHAAHRPTATTVADANASPLSPQHAEPHEGQDGHGQRPALPEAPPARVRDLVADIGAGRGAETLPAAVRREEDPAPAGKQRPERFEGLVVQHPGRAAVVVENGRKRTRPDRSVEHSVERTVARVDRDDLTDRRRRLRLRSLRQKEKAEDQVAGVRSHPLMPNSSARLCP